MISSIIRPSGTGGVLGGTTLRGGLTLGDGVSTLGDGVAVGE
jgi:hypothetical protein